jgi:hypothetical protein
MKVIIKRLLIKFINTFINAFINKDKNNIGEREDVLRLNL